MRDHYGDVGVPVFIMSGWQDGYKNPVEHVVTGLPPIGKAVAGSSAPGATNIRSTAIPGPRVDWLELHRHPLVGPLAQGQDAAARDRMAADRRSGSATSKEPSKSACDDEIGKWVAEDGMWQSRVKEKHLLSAGATSGSARSRSTPR